MAETEKPPFEPNLVLEQATLTTFAPRKGRKNAQGDEIEPPSMVFQFRVPVERVERYLSALTKAWKNERGITLGLAFVEQMELRLTDRAEKNGSGPVPDGLEPIAGGKGSKKRGKERATART